MASHLGRLHTTSGRERATERSKANNTRTPLYKEPIRLRNACDQCHQLKRKCSGDLPCENCSLSNCGDLCLYRPANRLGRPRGSRNRQKSSTHSRTNSKQNQVADSQRKLIDASTTTEPMSFPSEPMEPLSSVDKSWDYMLDEDLLSIISKSNTDMVPHALPPSNFDEHMDSCPSSITSAYSTISESMFATVPHQQPSHEQRLQQDPLLEWQQFSPSPEHGNPRGSPDEAGSLDGQNKDSIHHTRTQRPPCQCAQGLRTLLTSLGRGLSSASSGSQTAQASERQPYPIDTVLSNATRALERWTTLETCLYCCSAPGEEQQLENLFLLAFRSVQCVLGQLRSLTPDSGFAADASVRVGNFDVTGPARTTVLSMLRANTAREIERSVEAFRCKINDLSTANDGTSSLLAEIGVMFEDLMLDIRMLQQQRPIVERRG